MTPTALARAMSRLTRFFSDPTKGIEYNELNTSRKISRGIYRLDIARHPRIVKGIIKGRISRCDVLAEAEYANSECELVRKYEQLVKGRSS